MEIADYLKFVFALAFVLSLIFLLAFIAKRYGMGYRHLPRTNRKRLAISEIIPLDAKRRLVLVKCDSKEHLLVIGGSSDLVIDKNIMPNTQDFAGHLASTVEHREDNL